MAGENSYKGSIDQVKTDIQSIIEYMGQLDARVASSATNLANAAKKLSAASPKEMSGAIDAQRKGIGELTDAMSEQSKKAEELAMKKRALNMLTGQEVENNKILTRNAREQSKLQSTLVGAYEKLNIQRNIAKRNLQNLLSAENQNTAAIKKAQREYDVLTAKINRANGATQNFAKGGLLAIGRGMQNLLAAFGVVGGLYLFADLAKQGFNLAKTLDSLNFAMRTVISDSDELYATQAFLADITERYGAAIVTTTERYTKFRAAAMQSNVTMEDTQKIFGTMTKAAGALGLKTHELEGIYLALEQMLSKGKVTTEELRRQLGERLPGAFGIMADALGVTTSELDSMLRKGEILSSEALPKFADAVEKAYGIESLTHVENLNASATRLSNSWVSLVGNVTESEGVFSKALMGIMNLVRMTVEGFEIMISTYDDLLEKSVQANETDAYTNTLAALKEEAKRTGEAVELLAEQQADAAADRVADLEEELKAQQNIVKHLEETKGKRGGIWNSDTNNQWSEAKEKIEETSKALGIWNGVLRASQELEGRNKGKDQQNKQFYDREQLLERLTALQEEYHQTAETDAGTRERLRGEITELERRLKVWDLTNKAKAASKKLDKDYTEQDNFKLHEGRLRREMEMQEEIRDNEEKSLIERLDANREATEKEIELLTWKKDFAVKEAGDRTALVKAIEEEFYFDRAQIAQKGEDRIEEIRGEDFDKRVAGFEKLQDANERAMEQEIYNMKKAMHERGATAEEIEKEVEQIKLRYLKENLRNEIEHAIKSLEIMATTEEEKLAIQERIFALRAKLLDLEIGKETEVADKKKLLLEDWLMAAADIGGEIGNLFAAFSDRRMVKIEDEMAAMNEMYDKQLANENLTDERRKEIEDERERRTAELEKRKREERIKAAQAEKKFAIFETALNTAAAIVKGLKDGGLPLALIYGALGALQMATIIATPIPKYAKGRKGGKEEMAILGDGGKHEPILDSKGNLKGISPNTPTLMKLEQGDYVLPSTSHLSKDYQSILNASIMTTLASATVNNDSDKLARIFDQKLSKLDSKIENGIANGFSRIPVQGNRDLDALANRLKFINKRDAI